MKQKGSVTVFFSLIFMVMFSFILSFFEMAAYTARASYHASAALLATENYFAAFLEPLYEEYHIFGREVPVKEDVFSWTRDIIAEDVSYMTEKRDGEKSLLRRSGAKFDVREVSLLTDHRLEGFYSQAVTAMKYRSVLEVAEIVKGFAGITEQADAHMEIATAKAATDSAYAKVDERVLSLIELVDGVDIVKYEKFMGGKEVLFQKDVYVKYFCTDPAGAAVSFDRTEVYRSFLGNYRNPYVFLDKLSSDVERLATRMDRREYDEMICRSGLARVNGALSVVRTKLTETEESLNVAYKERILLTSELGKLLLLNGKDEEITELTEQMESVDERIKTLKAQRDEYETEEKELRKEQDKWEEEQRSLEKEKREQEKSAKALMKEEEEFVRQSTEICGLCDKAYETVTEIKKELEKAKKVRDTCETVLNALSPVIGNTAEKEYRADLEEYCFYENAEGLDFERMQQTLSDNKSRLRNIQKHIKGTTVAELKRAVSGLRGERDTVKMYSFDGLKISYGDMSLEENLYEGVESMMSKKLAKGILGFLTEKEISEKELDTAYLPSGFRYEEEESDLFSLLGTDMSGIFEELRKLLPSESSFESTLNGVTDTLLFHAYLTTHFSEFMEENTVGALSYEQEYLIAGKETDEENLSSVAMRICAMRTALHFLSLYTDNTRKAPAEQAALAACGIIGLPALKSIVVFLLLFVWALEEALIDTAALLQGKKLLLYPGREGGSLSFSEIVLFSKSFIQEKAEKKPNAKGVSFGYGEFLHLFLFLTPKEEKKYRAADLIQENLRKTYQSAFRFGRCVWKISYEVDEKEYEYAYN